jgi:hypothetical protein
VEGRAPENRRRRTTFGSGNDRSGFPTWHRKFCSRSRMAVRFASPPRSGEPSREGSAGWAVPSAPAPNGSSRTGVHWSATTCTWLGTQAWVAGELVCKEAPESRAEAEPCSRPSSYVGENGVQPVGEPAWETERYPARKVSAADKAALSPAKQEPSREPQQLAVHTGVWRSGR